jgi:hypothetical protein
MTNEVEMSPIETIMKMVGANTEEDAITAVWNLKESASQLESLMNSLTVVPVVMAHGQPLFVQLPPNSQQEAYTPALLESVRDALVEASVYLRGPLLRSRAKAKSEE